MAVSAARCPGARIAGTIPAPRCFSRWGTTFFPSVDKMGSRNRELWDPGWFVKKITDGGEGSQQCCAGKLALDVCAACKNTAFGLCRPGFPAYTSSSLRLHASALNLLRGWRALLRWRASEGLQRSSQPAGCRYSWCCSQPRSCSALVYRPAKRIGKKDVSSAEAPGGGEGHSFCACTYPQEGDKQQPFINLSASRCISGVFFFCLNCSTWKPSSSAAACPPARRFGRPGSTAPSLLWVNLFHVTQQGGMFPSSSRERLPAAGAPLPAFMANNSWITL